MNTVDCIIKGLTLLRELDKSCLGKNKFPLRVNGFSDIAHANTDLYAHHSIAVSTNLILNGADARKMRRWGWSVTERGHYRTWEINCCV